MSEHAATLDPTATGTTADVSATWTETRLVRRGLALVVVFWWVATGLIIAMQRTEGTRLVALVVATALAAMGLRELIVSRDDRTAAGARLSFLGGAMLWGWISVTFYGGFVTGFAPEVAVPPAPSWAAVPPAIAATLVSDLSALFILALAAFAVRGAHNRTGVTAFAIFWSVQQVAKLNVFFGVENPAGNFLPQHLAYLQQFFGPRQNSWLLWTSLAALSAVTWWYARRGVRARTAGERQAQVLYATIVGLAVLEIAILGMRIETTPWDAFLRARGT